MEPKFYTDAAGNRFELAPAKVDRKGLVKELAEAQAAAKQIDDNVAKLEAEVETLTTHLSEVNTVLAKQMDDQEAAHELVGFRRGRLESFDAPDTLDRPVVDEAPSAALEDLEYEPGPTFESPSEELDDSDDAEPIAGEPQEVELTIRRRSRA